MSRAYFDSQLVYIGQVDPLDPSGVFDVNGEMLTCSDFCAHAWEHNALLDEMYWVDNSFPEPYSLSTVNYPDLPECPCPY